MQIKTDIEHSLIIRHKNAVHFRSTPVIFGEVQSFADVCQRHYFSIRLFCCYLMVVFIKEKQHPNNGNNNYNNNIKNNNGDDPIVAADSGGK